MERVLEGIKFLLEKPYRLFIIVAVVFLFFALTSFHSSFIVKDYEKSIGEICNLEEVRVLEKQRYVTRYNYDLVWYSDDEVYEKKFKHQIDKREEGETVIWVQPDNRNAVFSNSVEIGKNAYIYLIIGLVAGVSGLFLLIKEKNSEKLSGNQKIEKLEDRLMYSVIAFILCLVGIGFQLWDAYVEKKAGEYVNPVMYDFSAVCGIIAVVCVILFISAKYELKSRYNKWQV